MKLYVIVAIAFVSAISAFGISNTYAENYESPNLITTESGEYIRSLDSDNGITITTSDTGGIYIYDDTMKLTQIIRTPDEPDGVKFIDVKIEGNNILASGQIVKYGGCDYVRIIFHYDLNSGKLLNQFTPLNSNNNVDCFETYGHTFDLSNDKILVTARHYEGGSDVKGTAYVHDLSNGNLLYTIDSPLFEPTPDLTQQDYADIQEIHEGFGAKATISEKYIIITESKHQSKQGGSFKNTTPNVYVFDSNNGKLLHTLTPSNSSGNHGDLEIKGDVLFIDGVQQIFQYDLTNGKLIKTFNIPDDKSNGCCSISVKENYLLVGRSLGENEGGIVFLINMLTGEIKEFQNPFDDKVVCDMAGCHGDGFGDTVTFMNNDILVLSPAYFDRGGGLFHIAISDNPDLPIISIPKDITQSTDSDLAVIEFTVTATDGNKRKIDSSCKPESKSVFLLGTTIVTCKAVDSSGNTAIETFTVTINKSTYDENQIVCPQGLEPINGKCPDKPVVEVTAEPKLGIASFVDKSKKPQSYIDRYNSEPTYKKWFDDNYSQYESIEQAVGLELNQKIPSWVKNIFGWYAADQVSENELLEAIKYLINQKILVVN